MASPSIQSVTKTFTAGASQYTFAVGDTGWDTGVSQSSTLAAVTWRQSDSAQHANRNFRWILETSGNTVTLDLPANLGADTPTTLQLIEFPNGCTVEYVTGTVLDGSTSTTITITEVDTAKTFAMPLGLAWADNGTGANYAFTYDITDSTTLTVTRGGSTGAVPFNTAIVTLDNATVTKVEPASLDINAAGLPLDTTVSAHTLNQTFTVGGFRTNSTVKDTSYLGMVGYPQSTTNYRITADTVFPSAASYNATVYYVYMGSFATVQRPSVATADWPPSNSTASVGITAVDLDVTWLTGHGLYNLVHGGTSSRAQDDLLSQRLYPLSTTTVEMECGVDNSGDTQAQYFQVIEFNDQTAAAANPPASSPMLSTLRTLSNLG